MYVYVTMAHIGPLCSTNSSQLSFPKRSQMHRACRTMDVNYVAIVSAPSDEAHNALGGEGGLAIWVSMDFHGFPRLVQMIQNTSSMSRKRAEQGGFHGNGETSELPPRHA